MFVLPAVEDACHPVHKLRVRMGTENSLFRDRLCIFGRPQVNQLFIKIQFIIHSVKRRLEPEFILLLFGGMKHIYLTKSTFYSL